MCWASSKRGVARVTKSGIVLSAYLLAFAPAYLPSVALAEAGVVNSVGTGRDTVEASVSLLRSVVAKYFKDENPTLVRNVLQNEIIINASSFVQSYRIAEGGKKGAVTLSANVDLDVVGALFHFTPAALGEIGGARALVVTRGAKLPESTESAKGGVINPYLVLEAGAKERLVRRNFDVVTLSSEEQNALSPGDDVASPELLRGLGARAGARIAFGLTSRYEVFENENSHSKDQRVVLSAILLDVKTGAILGRASVNVSDPKSRKEQYIGDLQRSFGEEGKDLFHEIFVSAGKRLTKSAPGKEDFSLVRVQYPSNATLVTKFRAMVESTKGVQSFVEYSITRGEFDFALRPAMKNPALTKIIKGLVSEDINVILLESTCQAGPSPCPEITVKLTPKEAAAEPGREVQSEEF